MRLDVIVQCAGRGPCELFLLAVQRNLKQFDVVANVRGVRTRLAVRGPDVNVVAAFVEVRYV